MSKSIQSCNHLFDLSPRVWDQFEHVLQFDLWRRQNLSNYTNRRTIAIFLKSHEIKLIFNQKLFARFGKKNKLLFIPSVGPGYDDTKIRPWNGVVSKDRFYENIL